MREQASSTLKSLATIVSGDLTEAVASTTVASWRETLAMILTYAREEEFITLCQQLGERLEQLGARDEALLCSICAVDVSSLLRLGLGASQDYRVRSHLSVMEVLLILCTMVPVQDLHLDAKLATLGEKLAVLCEALEAQGMNSITSHFLQSLRSAPSAQSLLQAMAAAVPELLPGFHPVAPQQPVAQQQQPVVSQPMAPQFAKPSAPSVQPMMPAPLNPPMPAPKPFTPAAVVPAPKPFMPTPFVPAAQPTMPQPTMPQPTMPQPTMPQPTMPQPTMPQPEPQPEVEYA